MIILDETKKRYGNLIYITAFGINDAETERVVNETQKQWDNGDVFSGLAYFGVAKRESDSEDEIAACAKSLQTALEQIVIDGWMSKYTRDDLIAACSALYKSPDPLYASIHLSGIAMTADDMIRRWNDVHADEESIVSWQIPGYPNPDIG